MPICTEPSALYQRGLERIKRFCLANSIPVPYTSTREKDEWFFDNVCAFYRPYEGISICLRHCARVATEARGRNWNWPGATTDREPYGVLAHELGHHCDWFVSDSKGTYFGSYGIKLEESARAKREKPISGYCPNPAEFTAEMMRLFITNHALLERIRPRTYEIIRKRFQPVSNDDWVAELGPNVPCRIVENLWKKVRR